MSDECCRLTTDRWCATHSTGEGPVYPVPVTPRAGTIYAERDALRAILTDLITYLRPLYPEVADHYEARLWEVTGNE